MRPNKRERESAREASRPSSLRPAPPASPSTTKVRMEWTPAERHVESHVERPAEHVPVKTHIHDGLTTRPIRGSPTVDHQLHTIALSCPANPGSATADATGTLLAKARITTISSPSTYAGTTTPGGGSGPAVPLIPSPGSPLYATPTR
ncbi:hypothetical protein VTJ04DRAFT_7228 [Mycothermus thermophilus]|uniref:uncharacterized protein n=1 Tax=Humicola insolens TaxID=85995 RepID=UPI003744A002